MILIFLGSVRATVAVFFSIPLSALATFIALQIGGSSINTMVLGGLALALSRLIDNSVVVLENIYRHLEMGEPPAVAAEQGGREVALPVLAATLTTVVVFFPGHAAVRRQQVSVLRAGAGGSDLPVRVLCRGDDRGAAVLRALPDNCAASPAARRRKGWAHGSTHWFNRGFDRCLDSIECR